MPDQRIDVVRLAGQRAAADRRGAGRGRDRPALLGAGAHDPAGATTAPKSRSIAPTIDLAALPRRAGQRLPATRHPLSDAQPLLPGPTGSSGSCRRIAPAWRRRAGGGARRLGRRQRSTIAPRPAPGDTTALDTFADPARACAATMRICWWRWRAPARSRRAASPPMRPASIRPTSMRSPNCGSTARWHLVDATGMASCGDIARVVVGRDATDIAFMTVFGGATCYRQSVSVRRT